MIKKAYAFAFLTKHGGMQAEAVWYFIPSSNTCFISFHVAETVKRVWSQRESISSTFIVYLRTYILPYRMRIFNDMQAIFVKNSTHRRTDDKIFS